MVGTVHYGYGWDAACPYPDSGCAAYSGSSGVQLSPLHATLSLTSDELHDGELWVWPGMEYDVRAVASPAQMGQFQVPILPTGSGWTFTPDSGAAQGDFCRDGGDRLCTVASNKSGYLRLTALVNGEQMESPPLRLQTPKLSVAVSDTSLRVGDTLVLTTSLRGADASILTGYYAGYTASLTQGTQPEGLTSNSSSQGLPPCLGTQPVPLHCYIVMTAPGRALVGVSAKIGRTYFGDYKYVSVRSAARLHVAIVTSSRTMLEFSRHIHAKGCKSTDDISTRKLHVFVIDSGTATPVKLANKVINLELAPVIPADPMTPDAGGHVVSVHVGNPKPSGSLSAIEVTTDANGDAYVTYAAPEFAGKYEVRASSQGAAPAADTVTVGIVLQQLVAGAHFGLVGQTTAHPSNHFGTPKMNAQLVEFADETYDMLGVSVEFNDISLPLGGRFEVKDTNDPVLAWSNLAPCDHREGQGTDLRTNPYMDAKKDTKEKPSIAVQNMMSSWKTLNPDWKDPKHLPYFWEGDHLHLKVKP